MAPARAKGDTPSLENGRLFPHPLPRPTRSPSRSSTRDCHARIDKSRRLGDDRPRGYNLILIVIIVAAPVRVFSVKRFEKVERKNKTKKHTWLFVYARVRRAQRWQIVPYFVNYKLKIYHQKNRGILKFSWNSLFIFWVLSLAKNVLILQRCNFSGNTFSASVTAWWIIVHKFNININRLLSNQWPTQSCDLITNFVYYTTINFVQSRYAHQWPANSFKYKRITKTDYKMTFDESIKNLKNKKALRFHSILSKFHVSNTSIVIVDA